jgi:3-hydroxyacyl-CoA dehydrogenase
MPVQISKADSVAIVAMTNGAVNTLSIGNGFVDELAASIQTAVADPDCSAIVLTGRGRYFSAGADINDFDRDPASIGRLRALIEAIENSPKPVVMALHGMVLGGGLELALAGHARIALNGTRFGLPEVTLGLLPGAGGTQRLPRLIGLGPALTMMLGGKPVTSAEALALGLIDRVVEEDVLAAAVDHAITLQPPLRRAGMLAVPADIAIAIVTEQAKPGCSEAQLRILDSVAALDETLARGLAREAELFEEAMRSDLSRGLRHAFLGERIAGRIPGLEPDTLPREVRRVGVVGGGTMGTGIAIVLLNGGLSVTLVEPRDEALAKARATIDTTMRRDVEKGRLDQTTADARRAALTASTRIDALADTDLVIEAVFEDLAVKRQVFTELDRVTRADAILASNTSTLDLDMIATFVRDPSRVVGLHFFSPANIMRLLEVVRGRSTAADILVTSLALGKRLGKVPVVSGVCDGFIGNRMFEEYLRQAWFLLEEGALPQQIDAALETWGMAMGPCRTMDLVGQDIGWAIRKRRGQEEPGRPYSGVIDRICELGRLGQKTGAGIYAYPDGRTAEPDPAVEQLIVEHSAEIGLSRRSIEDEEIVERCLFALINEGARIVGEGIAYRPVDVDIVYLNGYGFPRERGGPMFQADLIGIPAILQHIRRFEKGRHGWAWTPAPLIEQLSERGDGFKDLNR